MDPTIDAQNRKTETAPPGAKPCGAIMGVHVNPAGTIVAWGDSRGSLFVAPVPFLDERFDDCRACFLIQLKGNKNLPLCKLFNSEYVPLQVDGEGAFR